MGMTMTKTKTKSKTKRETMTMRNMSQEKDARALTHRSEPQVQRLGSRVSGAFYS